MSRHVLSLAMLVSAALSVGLFSALPAQEPGGKPRKVEEDRRGVANSCSPAGNTRSPATRRPSRRSRASTRRATPRGRIVCVCCGAPLFSSRTKFDSGTGWPSFYQPIDPKAVDTAPDHETAEPRVEVMCNDCGAHLGHVFNDGPAADRPALLHELPLAQARPRDRRQEGRAPRRPRRARPHPPTTPNEPGPPPNRSRPRARTPPTSDRRRPDSRSALLLLEVDRGRVDAVAEAGRRGSVVEDVAEVAAATPAGDFGPAHPVAPVLVLLDLRRRRTAGKKLGQPQPESNLVSDVNSVSPQPGAAVRAGRLDVPVRAGEGAARSPSAGGRGTVRASARRATRRRSSRSCPSVDPPGDPQQSTGGRHGARRDRVGEIGGALGEPGAEPDVPGGINLGSGIRRSVRAEWSGSGRAATDFPRFRCTRRFPAGRSRTAAARGRYRQTSATPSAA